MNEYGYLTAPEWAQAAMVIGEMLRAFAGRGSRTIVSLTEDQSEAVRFADAFMEGHHDARATLFLERILAPIDAMPWCDCGRGKVQGCHVHKPQVAAALARAWVDRGAKAQSLHDVDELDGAWKVIADLARAAGGAAGKHLDQLAESAFNKAREIVGAQTNQDPAAEVRAVLREVLGQWKRSSNWCDCPSGCYGQELTRRAEAVARSR